MSSRRRGRIEDRHDIDIAAQANFARSGKLSSRSERPEPQPRVIKKEGED
jgi:hypothetical protein